MPSIQAKPIISAARVAAPSSSLIQRPSLVAGGARKPRRQAQSGLPNALANPPGRTPQKPRGVFLTWPDFIALQQAKGSFESWIGRCPRHSAENEMVNEHPVLGASSLVSNGHFWARSRPLTGHSVWPFPILRIRRANATTTFDWST